MGLQMFLLVDYCVCVLLKKNIFREYWLFLTVRSFFAVRKHYVNQSEFLTRFRADLIDVNSMDISVAEAKRLSAEELGETTVLAGHIANKTVKTTYKFKQQQQQQKHHHQQLTKGLLFLINPWQNP